MPAPRNEQADRLDYLDGWRGMAIALVLESHFFGSTPLDDDLLGVDIFFCLSGFLMSGILFIQRQPLRKFYKRRISRIIPVFAVFVLSVYTFAAATGRAFTPNELVSTLFFLRTYFPAHPGIWDTTIPIGHLWSLNVEEHSYIFMSTLILMRVLRGREGIALLLSGTICIVIGVIYARLGTAAPPWRELGTEVAAAHLLISAGYRLVNARVKPLVPLWLPLLTLLVGFACYANVAPWWWQPVLSPFLFAFTINHLPESAKWLRSILSMQLLRALGVWSFSIYLWQQPFQSGKDSFPGGPTAAFVCTILAGILSFYVIEKPCRSWLNRNW